MVVEFQAASIRMSSPDILPLREATKKEVPHVDVGGICSVRWSQAPIFVGTSVHSWLLKKDIGFVDVILTPVESELEIKYVSRRFNTNVVEGVVIVVLSSHPTMSMSLVCSGRLSGLCYPIILIFIYC